MVDINMGSQGIAFDFTRLNAGLAAVGVANAHEGAALVMNLYRTYGTMLERCAAAARLVMQRAASETPVRDAFAATGFAFFAAGSATGTEENDECGHHRCSQYLITCI